MSIGPLRVLHLKEVNHQGIDDNPLSQFKNQFLPFAPMTCARHVYVFPIQDPMRLDELTDYLKDHTSGCELLVEGRAYEFLLRWAVGCESWKLKGNDHFVLGAIRKHWTEYKLEHPEQAKSLDTVMTMLFEDASNIRRVIQEYIENCHDKSFSTNEALRKMCANCCLSRFHLHKPDYDNLLIDSMSYLTAAQKSHMARRIKTIEKSLAALNLKAGATNLDPSDFVSGSKDEYVRRFQQSLNLAFEKKALTLSAHQDSASKESEISQRVNNGKC